MLIFGGVWLRNVNSSYLFCIINHALHSTEVQDKKIKFWKMCILWELKKYAEYKIKNQILFLKLSSWLD